MPRVRKSNTRQLNPVLHIFCEGKKTEPQYLQGYLKKLHPGNVRLKVVKIEVTRKNTPKELVKEAINLKKNKATPSVDDFWVVYDREDKAEYSDELHQQALVQAKANDIKVAFSNVCFEVWILLHLANGSAAYSSYKNLLKNSPLKAKLKDKGVIHYEKGDPLLFEKIADGLALARTRAVKMNQTTQNASTAGSDKPHLLNPYTDVYKLLDAIDTFVKTKPT